MLIISTAMSDDGNPSKTLLSILMFGELIKGGPRPFSPNPNKTTFGPKFFMFTFVD